MNLIFCTNDLLTNESCKQTIKVIKSNQNESDEGENPPLADGPRWARRHKRSHRQHLS